MRVTIRTRHAMRALYDLAFHRRGQAVQAKEIAERQGIPLRFLEQILQDLRRAGLVETRRGPRGGYVLARAPEQISLADVLRAVRGPLEALLGAGELAPRRRARAATSNGSTAHPLTPPAAAQADIPALAWAEVSARLIGVLEHATLAEFIARAEAAGAERAPAPSTMYFI